MIGDLLICIFNDLLICAKYLSKKDSSTMLPELTEFVPAIRMGIVRKVLLGLENRAGCIFFTSSQCF
jgi:hypothetical protein